MICPCYSGSRCKSTYWLTSTYWVAWNSTTQMLRGCTGECAGAIRVTPPLVHLQVYPCIHLRTCAHTCSFCTRTIFTCFHQIQFTSSWNQLRDIWYIYLHLTFDWLEFMVNVGNYSVYVVSGIDYVQYIRFQPLQDDPREKPTSRYMCMLRSRMGQQYSELTEISWGQEKLKSVPSLKLT